MLKQPKIRFPNFQKIEGVPELHRIGFDEIFDFSTGKNIKQNEASPEFKFPCVRYGELYHLYDEVIKKTINRTNLNTDELHFSQGNEILLPSAGEDPLDIGSASALTLKDVAIGRTINILRPKNIEVTNQIFAAYYINFVLRKDIAKLARGSSISNVYNSDLKSLSIVLPSLPEQKKIADFLGAVDDKIAGLCERERLLADYKKGVMQKIFTQTLRFKADDGSNFPEWVGSQLRKICNVSTGKLDANAQTSGGKYRFYTCARGYSFTDTHSFSGPAIITPGNGDMGLVQRYDGKFDAYQRTYVLTDFLEYFDFIYYYLEHFLPKRIHREINVGAMPYIKLGTLTDMDFRLPCFAEQQKIADFLSAIDEKVTAVSTQITQMQNFKKGLLQQMFV